MTDPLEMLAERASRSVAADEATRLWREHERRVVEKPDGWRYRPGDLMTEAQYYAVREAALQREAAEAAQVVTRGRRDGTSGCG